MEGKILGSVGKVAGLGGIGVGVFLFVFQGVLQKQFLPQAGLASAQAFAIILALMILTFGIAAIGLIAWLVSRSVGPRASVPLPAMGTLSALIVFVVGAAVYVGAQTRAASELSGNVQASPGGVAIGRDAIGSTINIGAAPTSK